ncbi:hypothetical protein Gasu2_10900 [Galdieria sulphuraria]|uniref:Uncharacterized protein n=1 Tax=Galdieria sulphuraria TaxID=130081 RepID=M2Y8A9_GALSU|nr:uncharacterized protein Gasu_08180 [Galdieria sulphuraria]EME32074.1 hypothetical protein Gasu_08180 [Galdieria sulphuraria]GJD06688.1 hypothetical protein Gasu2_10900 [Galdieria sulphuraria]|eukprot:XP_005708594.1 hypothetical protein Gasu_08180 [Galdieria sulphuraria]
MELLSNVYKDVDDSDEDNTQVTDNGTNNHPSKNKVNIDVTKFFKLPSVESEEQEKPQVEPLPKRPRKDTSGRELLQMLPAPKKQAPIKDIRVQKWTSGTRSQGDMDTVERNLNDFATSTEVTFTQQQEQVTQKNVEENGGEEIDWSKVQDERVVGDTVDASYNWPETSANSSKEFLRDINQYGDDIAFVDVQFSDLVDTSKPDETFVTRQSASTSEVVSKLARVAGKVTRIQKERHQLNAVAADLAAKQVELEEKRSQSRQTKAETWAKYGW